MFVNFCEVLQSIYERLLLLYGVQYDLPGRDILVPAQIQPVIRTKLPYQQRQFPQISGAVIGRYAQLGFPAGNGLPAAQQSFPFHTFHIHFNIVGTIALK